MWKIELASDETEYFAEEISKQSFEEMACSLLTAYNKIPKDRNELKKKLLSKKNSELKDLENSQPILLQKIRARVLKRTLRVWPNNHLIRRLVWV